jgi:hypothetical protein
VQKHSSEALRAKIAKFRKYMRKRRGDIMIVMLDGYVYSPKVEDYTPTLLVLDTGAKDSWSSPRTLEGLGITMCSLPKEKRAYTESKEDIIAKEMGKVFLKIMYNSTEYEFSID